MIDSILHLVKSPTYFLRLDSVEVPRHLDTLLSTLPSPRPILFHSGARDAPRYGFPLLKSPELTELGERLEDFLILEEQVLTYQSPGAIHAHLAERAAQQRDESWDVYSRWLTRACENVAASTYAQDYPEIFWLFHSLDIARVIRDAPKRGALIGAKNPQSLKYTVLYSYLDRVLPLVYDLTEGIALETGEAEHDIFPALLNAMGDNVLILTEPRIGGGLEELQDYFHGYLKQDYEVFRNRIERFRSWHEERVRADPKRWSSLRQLLGAGELDDPLVVPGYLTYASTLDSYPTEELLSTQDVVHWERLIIRLKEYELMDSFRRLVVRLVPQGDAYCVDPKEAMRLGAGRRRLETRTRPIDFMAPWLVDPEVSRGGLMYDLTDFTATVTELGLDDAIEQERAFRGLLGFQRHFDQLAHFFGMRFEKYMGDGAFYSAMELAELMLCAIRMQRLYDDFVTQGFAFDRGIRMAINFGDYRLMPFGDRRTGLTRYETVGIGVVELTRLVSGKSGVNLSQIRAVLEAKGFSPERIDELFRPIEAEESEQAFPQPASGARSSRYDAYIDSNGTLVNQGIVATRRYLQMLQDSSPPRKAFRVENGGRRYVAVVLEHEHMKFTVGLRMLGVPSLKGIKPLTVYEVVDGGGWNLDSAEAVPEPDLISLTEEAFHQGFTLSVS